MGEAMTVSKAVITAAGLGTRLLPMTKEVPKENATGTLQQTI